MAKFYVQCGMRGLVVDAADAESAGMHLIDTAMQPHLWIYDDAGLSDQQRQDHLMLEALMHMAPEIWVSEQGFDRPDSLRLGTPETIIAWHQTMASLSHLLISAGLVPRRMRQLATAPTSASKRGLPRLADDTQRQSDGIDWTLRPIRRAR
ncbi:MAG: hypothetical protein AAF670_10870 [Planctomycetota bacterium]